MLILYMFISLELNYILLIGETKRDDGRTEIERVCVLQLKLQRK